MSPPDNYPVLLMKAHGDELAARRLMGDLLIPDEIIGFHAQQAVEKLIKAVLSFHHVVYPRTHNLVELIKLTRRSGIEVPEELNDARLLTPFAAVSRYDDVACEEDEPLDRQWAMNCIHRTRRWAEGLIPQP